MPEITAAHYHFPGGLPDVEIASGKSTAAGPFFVVSDGRFQGSRSSQLLVAGAQQLYCAQVLFAPFRRNIYCQMVTNFFLEISKNR